MKLLITCVPMILRIKEYDLSNYNFTIPKIKQTMEEEELINIIEDYDAWIAGDDPVTQKVLDKAKNLKILVKWGIGIDNIDLDAIKKTNIEFTNTPGMFGDEVSDVAIGYLISLTRKLYQINNEVKNGNWYKPSGISLKDKKVALIGFGDIGRNIADRLISLKTKVHVYDPGFKKENGKIECLYTNMEINERLNEIVLTDNIKEVLENSRILILACAANKENYKLVNEENIKLLEDKCYIVNVSRGSLVNEKDIIAYIKNRKIEGFASDVFEKEPIINSELLNMDNVILGSHNASNTQEAVDKTSFKSLEIINFFFQK